MGKYLKNKRRSSEDPSWKNIKQLANRRPTTGRARLRRWLGALRGMAWVLGLAAVVAGAGAALWGFKRITDGLYLSGPSTPLYCVEFTTDGVLTQQWLIDNVAIPIGEPLNSVDIYSLKRKIESEGQVLHATVERSFPNTLKVQITEVRPVLRVAVASKKAQMQTWLISSIGTVFSGHGYPSDTLTHLPYLEGVRLKLLANGKFSPVQGIQPLTALLDDARMQFPEIYRDWKSAKFVYPNPDEPFADMVEIKSRNWGLIVFSLKNSMQQLERLSAMIQYFREHSMYQIKKIDLTLEDQAAVQFTQSPSLARVKR